jgi:hypothetical protein
MVTIIKLFILNFQALYGDENRMEIDKDEKLNSVA